jgi:hypothetical protein
MKTKEWKIAPVYGTRQMFIATTTRSNATWPGLTEEQAKMAEHRANAYPKLVEALRELMLRCDGEEGVRADGSNVQTMRASALLAELGEV